MRPGLAALATLLACQAQAPDLPSPPGPDCAALLALGERARGCDPRIEPLLAELRHSPDEPRCRGAARLLLQAPTPARGQVVSVYERAPAPDTAAPLTADEQAALLASPLPGRLTLTPDLSPGPGVPNTTATVDGLALSRDGAGRLVATGAPGRHLLRVRHADRESQVCLTLRACEEVAVIAHGAALAAHPAVRPGPCEP